MSKPDNLGSFLKDSKPLLKEYLETRMEIFRLQAVKILSRSAAYLIWVIVCLFLFFLILIFSGMTLGWWLSRLTNSEIMGFGLTTLIYLLLFALLAVFRKALFIHPVMDAIIEKALEEEEGDLN